MRLSEAVNWLDTGTKEWRKFLEMEKEYASQPSLHSKTLTEEVIASKERLYQLYEKEIPSAEAVYQTTLSSEKKAEESLNLAKNNLQNLEILNSFYKECLEKLTQKYLDSLSQLLTDVYHSVYQNPNKQVKLVMVDYRNKKVVRLQVTNTIDGQSYAEELDDASGSETVLMGLVLSIYFLIVTKQPRIIFIDEVFSSLHDDVFQRVLAMLQKFVTKFGFSFLIIDHNLERSLPHANKLYTVGPKGKYKELDPELSPQAIEQIVDEIWREG